MINPSQLLKLVQSDKMRVESEIALDTETSGLHVDDGARVSTVSVAWIDESGAWEKANKKHGWGLTVKKETVYPGYKVRIVSAAWPFDQGVAGTGKPEDFGQMTLLPEADNLDKDEFVALLKFLSFVGESHGLVYHNAKFDMHMMRTGVRRWPGVGMDLVEYLLWDTQNGNSLLYPLLRDPKTHNVTTSLKPSSQVMFGHDVADEQTKVRNYLRGSKLPAGRWDLMPWDIVSKYADMDARLTLMLKLRQQYEIEHHMVGSWLYPDGATPEEQVASVYDALQRRLDVTVLLYNMEKRGLPYDEQQSLLAYEECSSRAAEHAKGLPFRPTEPAAKDYYFTNKKNDKGNVGLNLVPYSVTEKGNPQLTAEILIRMVNDKIPFAKEFADYQKATNAASMWYKAYAEAIGPDGRIRTNFRQNGTRSHRFSVERINLQAIPQDYRLEGHAILEGIPTPRDIIGTGMSAYPGWKLWELDLAQAELRVAAMYAKCKRMLSMIANGEDLHDYTTAELFDMDHTHKHWFQHRQIGKRGNFSLIFGSGAATFKSMISKETGLILDDPVAIQIVRDWNRLYPEYGRTIDIYMSRVQRRQARHGFGWIDLNNRERRWFEEYEDSHKAFNQRVQPNLAQFGIDWMLKSEEILRDSKIQDVADATGIGGVGLLLTIHDSQVIMVPDTKEGLKVIEACAEAGRELWRGTFDVPGDVDAKPFRKETAK